MSDRKKVCFFARVRNRDVIDRVEFYAQDVRALQDFGYDVEIAIRPWHVRRADLYFVWWWTWAFIPALVARLLRKPLIITGVFDYWDFDRRPSIHKRLMKWSLRTADVNVFVSQLELNEVPAISQTASPEYVPCAIDIDTYAPSDAAREPFVLTIATLRLTNPWRKSIPELIRAMPLVHAVYPGVRFVIAGDHEEQYPQLVRELGAEEYVQFPGIITKEEKIRLLQSCSVYAQPSRFEGFGLAIAEAMSCGAPVLTSNVGAIPEVVGDAGVFVDGTSPEQIAEGIIGLLQDDERRRALGIRGRERIERLYSYARHRDDWHQILRRLS
jgi:glycosyltransferase involved in cell wall biosynthesis